MYLLMVMPVSKVYLETMIPFPCPLGTARYELVASVPSKEHFILVLTSLYSFNYNTLNSIINQIGANV